MRTALYARVSTKDKRQDTENQLAQLRQFAATQRWTVVHEYVDKATGKHSDREQFQRLFAGRIAAPVRCGAVLVPGPIQPGGRPRNAEPPGAAGELRRRVSVVHEQYLDSCGIFKDAVLAILAVIAKQERVRLSERTLAGLARARKQGRDGRQAEGGVRPQQGAATAPGRQEPGRDRGGGRRVEEFRASDHNRLGAKAAGQQSGSNPVLLRQVQGTTDTGNMCY